MSLELRGLSVDIGGRPIVSDIDLLVPTGSLAGLIGANGSGKSTILKAIYRVRAARAGAVLVDGVDLLGLTAREAARRVAVVSQEHQVEFDVRVDQMVMLGRFPHQARVGRDTEEDRAIVADTLATVGCGDMAARSYHSLSGGEKQRVQIARALAQRADHLVLDEPTNHLDIRYQAEILELVSGLGITVLAALHDLGLAALFCDRLHLLAEGRLVASGPPAEVVTAETVRSSYGADVLVIAHPDTGAPQILARRSNPSQPSQEHR